MKRFLLLTGLLALLLCSCHTQRAASAETRTEHREQSLSTAVSALHERDTLSLRQSLRLDSLVITIERPFILTARPDTVFTERILLTTPRLEAGSSQEQGKETEQTEELAEARQTQTEADTQTREQTDTTAVAEPINWTALLINAGVLIAAALGVWLWFRKT